MDRPPTFLSGVLDAMALRRRAGEWDLVAFPTRPRAALDAFLAAFDWADVAELEISQRRWTEEHGGAFASWVMDHADGWEDATGFEAVLHLTLAWQAPDGRVGRSRLPRAGGLIVDVEADMATFVVWPNLFSDCIHLYERIGTRFEATPIPFAKAAQRNRQQLRTALHSWEAASSGEIVGWESELLEGLERHGVAADARVR